MSFKTLFTAAVTLLIAGLLTLPQPADARRMGSGGNVGKQYSTPAQAPGGGAAPAQAQRPVSAAGPAATAARPGQPGGAGRWLGPLAGLAAGGLLAALFFGGGFEGLQVLDFVLIAALVIGGILIFRALRRRQAPALPAAAYARTGTTTPGAVTPPRGAASGPRPVGTPVTGSGETPAWFDAAGFVAGAKGHYIRLQAAWDQANFSDLREYCTPELCAELERDRRTLADPQYTEVVQLEAALAGVRRDGDQAVASILFSGLIREEPQGPAQPFREYWHVQHQWASPAGDWYVTGIQQA